MKHWCLDVTFGGQEFNMNVVLIYVISYLGYKVICWLSVYSFSLCIFVCLNFSFSFSVLFFFKDFVGLSFLNPNETTIVHFKGLIAYAKYNCCTCKKVSSSYFIRG